MLKALSLGSLSVDIVKSCVAIATGTDAANTEDVQSSPLTLGKSKLSTGMTTLVVGGLVLLVIVMILVALVVVSLAVYLCRVKHNKVSHTHTIILKCQKFYFYLDGEKRQPQNSQ